MQTIFSRSPFERKLGQPYSWNAAGSAGSNMYSWNTYGMSPEQRLLKNAEESMKAPPPLTPQQRLMQNNGLNLAPSGEINSTPECFTCSNGSDVRSGVDGRTAAQLRSQGYRCRKDECAQQQQGYNYGNTPFNSGAWSSGGYGGAMMSGPLRVVNR